MKKILLVFTLFISLFISSFAVDAQTSKNKTSQRTTKQSVPFTVESFVKPGEGGNYLVFNKAALRGAGFKEYETVTKWDPFFNENAEHVYYKDSKGNRLQELTGERHKAMVIDFISEEERRNFLKGWENIFKKISSSYLTPGESNYVDMEEKAYNRLVLNDVQIY